MDITLKCPECGAEWPTTEVKARTDIMPRKLTPRHVSFHFPCNHFPTLARMMRDKIFSRVDGLAILRRAQVMADSERAVIKQEGDR